MKARLSFSRFLDLPESDRNRIIIQLGDAKFFRVELLSYCLMPTHYHFLLKQNIDSGLSHFISLVMNSFTRHVNLETDGLGPIFLTKFKSEQIDNDEELKHVSRYIHLNPYTSKLVNNISALNKYPWTSYREYIAGEKRLCNINPVMSLFNNKRESYRDFVENHADYQRTLETVKHASRWK
ncbi:hypothetical protein A3H78_01690 [Candidatus Roizmanbacteria bacterium RIFCSPLOWO2_02_FULL_36_11]|uniref:Transposase IS200-like domain-containing protein n=1 Tax=Candidatus Roizmanbacteria bacterium RIFCSPLOWO2_02_FULL_36_11 TaxID=1802071 RepID=A0A1F7JG27_9BACT|nr:MAG: hypothetical protein A3H78_01690 [Candidatus Roizmanbacteria bacterium RIFCSPLOWO2_02_FULL_36_11]